MEEEEEEEVEEEEEEQREEEGEEEEEGGPRLSEIAQHHRVAKRETDTCSKITTN